MKGFLPDQTRISQVHLRTAHLERAVEFYSGVLGLSASHGPDAQAIVSAKLNEKGLLVLSEDPSASPRLPRTTGLYHFALRYGTRMDLAQAYRRIVKTGHPLAGASDHGVSEAIYLSDPDGNGVELYADRPRSQWRWQNGQIAMVSTPLDLDNLLATVPDPTATKHPNAQIDLGHIHLHVADLIAAEQFYSEFLGLAVTQRSYPGALFFAVGAYHHHIGVNVWAGQGVSTGNSVGLVSYRLEVPVAEILYCLSHRAPLVGYETQMRLQEQGNRVLQIRDPNGSWLEVQASESAAVAGPRSLRADCPEHGNRIHYLRSKRNNNRLKIES